MAGGETQTVPSSMSQQSDIQLPQSGGGQVPQVDTSSGNTADIFQAIQKMLTMNKTSIPIPPPVQKQNMGEIAQGGVGRTKKETQRNSTQALMKNISSFVRTVKSNHDAKENRSLQYQLERFITAQNNLYNPDGTVNKSNQQIIHDMSQDPKLMKKFEKALDIHLLDPKENSKESQALFGAIKKTQPQGQRQGQGGSGQPMSENIPGGGQTGQAPPNSAMTPNSGGGPVGGGGFQRSEANPQSVQQGNNAAVNPSQSLNHPDFGPRMNRIMQATVAPEVLGISPLVQAYGQLVKMGVLPSADKQLEMQIHAADRQNKKEMADALIRSHEKIARATQAGEDRRELAKEFARAQEGILNRQAARQRIILKMSMAKHLMTAGSDTQTLKLIHSTNEDLKLAITQEQKVVDDVTKQITDMVPAKKTFFGSKETPNTEGIKAKFEEAKKAPKGSLLGDLYGELNTAREHIAQANDDLRINSNRVDVILRGKGGDSSGKGNSGGIAGSNSSGKSAKSGVEPDNSYAGAANEEQYNKAIEELFKDDSDEGSDSESSDQ